MAISKYTLANALAYVAITGCKRALHINTRCEMNAYCTLEPYTVKIGDEAYTLHRYQLTEEGWALAKTSRLWKAHEQLTELGFKVQADRRPKPYHISYTKWLDDLNRTDDAFTGAHGRVYAQDHAAGGERPWEYKMIGTHKNG